MSSTPFGHRRTPPRRACPSRSRTRRGRSSPWGRACRRTSTSSSGSSSPAGRAGSPRPTPRRSPAGTYLRRNGSRERFAGAGPLTGVAERGLGRALGAVAAPVAELGRREDRAPVGLDGDRVDDVDDHSVAVVARRARRAGVVRGPARRRVAQRPRRAVLDDGRRVAPRARRALGARR